MANGMPYYYNPHASFMRGMPADPQAIPGRNTQNWLTDPNAPWNVWAQNLEGYLQDWVSAQQQGLQAGLQQQNIAAGQRAIGQGLYTGTYTTSLPAENLAKMIAQNTQGYAGAMAQLQGTGLEQLIGGQRAYGEMMLNATQQDLWRQALAKAESYGIGDLFGDIVGMIPGVGQFIQAIKYKPS